MKTTTQFLFGAAFLLTTILPITASAQIVTVGGSPSSAQIVVEQFITGAPDVDDAFAFELGQIEVGGDEDDFLVVGVAFEGSGLIPELNVNGSLVGEPNVQSDNDGIQTAIFVIDDVSGLVDLRFETFFEIPSPGFYAASLSGVGGIETSGVDNSPEGTSILNTTLTGVGEGSFVLGVYSDQQGTQSNISRSGSDLPEVSNFGSNDSIGGELVGSVVAGFGTGEDLEVEFNDSASFVQSGNNPGFHNRSNFSFVSLTPALLAVPEPSTVIVLALAGLAATTRRRR